MAWTKPDRRRVLEALTEARRPMTTAELGAELQRDLRRLGQCICLMVQEHVLETGPRRPDGWSWMLTEVGARELARMRAAERGERYRAPVDPVQEGRYDVRSR